MNAPKYTQQEDSVILDYIAKYPNNISHAFSLAAQDIDRSIRAVSQRYYNKLKHKNKVLAVASNKGVITMHNQKNAPIMQGIKEEDILGIILASLRKLSKRSKLQVVNAILSF